MDKNNFITLLRQYPGSSAEEAEAVIALKSEYPYSQVLHTLAARVSKDHGLDDQETQLQQAAIHAADRSVLKEIITSPKAIITVSKETITSQKKETSVLISPIMANSERPEHPVSSGEVDYADEVMRDLEQLNTSKHNFEMLLVEYSEVTGTPATDTVVPAPAKKEGEIFKKQDSPAGESGPQEKLKSKKERIIELAKAAMHGSNSAEAADPKKSGPATGRKGNPADKLIEEIKKTKLEITPESEKQKEQIHIINQFIKTQPSISSAKERPLPVAGDLNPIKSGEFGDNIVSETLVEILIKQGKKDKAIEVLKKLIWKYPQKKSYFASQIEDLKK